MLMVYHRSMEKITIVVIGITGNLAKIKLIPALYDLFLSKQICGDCKILGVSRQIRSEGELRGMIDEAVISKKNGQIDMEMLAKFWQKFDFINGDLEDEKLYKKIKEKLGTNRQTIFYLATHPMYYLAIFNNLNKIGINKKQNGVKLMIEKPIGSDLKSAVLLNRLLIKFFDEGQIYRIDHYLGKETIQNILAFRFNNSIFEKLTQSELVDHIQITMSESFGAEARSAYYDEVGALKDVGQNHILQMLAFAVMDRPKEMTNEEITNKRLEVLQSLRPRPESLVLGQYGDYSTEKKKTNTFFAFKTEIGKGDLKGVPIYIRSGKKLAKSVAEIVMVFKRNGGFEDRLTYRIQPNEGIVIRFGVKQPGAGMEIGEGLMQFCFKSINTNLANPYEKLINDAINGDQTFFNDAKEVEAQWQFIDALKSEGVSPIVYEPGSWGPKEARDLIEKDGRKWIEPDEAYCRI